MNPAPVRLKTAAGSSQDRALEAVHEALGKLRFGTVKLTVHDGRVVQVDVTEKRRIDP